MNRQMVVGLVVTGVLCFPGFEYVVDMFDSPSPGSHPPKTLNLREEYGHTEKKGETTDMLEPIARGESNQLEQSDTDGDIPTFTDTVTNISASTTFVDESNVPAFHMNAISPEQCRSLTTTNCLLSTESEDCGPEKGLLSTCTKQAGNVEVEKFFRNIQKVNASRGLAVTLNGKREFLQEHFSLIADVLLVLRVSNYHGFQVSQLHDLRLPLLTHFAIANSKNVELKRDDLLMFPTLTMFVMYRSETKLIEEGAFENLGQLQLVTFDTGISTKRLRKDQRSYLWLLHCSCQYNWLRRFLEENPELISPADEGEVYSLGGISSRGFIRRQIYAPVDCAKKHLIGDVDQTEFSVNTKCKYYS